MKFFWKSIVLSGLLLISLAGCASEFHGGGDGGSKKQTAPAAINDVIITENEIRGEAAADLESIELQKLRNDAAYSLAEHEALMEAMERVLEEKLLTTEAAEQGISKEQLIDREIRQKIKEPSNEEINHVYELNRTRVNRPKEDVADQIRNILRERSEKEARNAFLDQLEKKHKVVRNLKPFRFDLKTAGYPSIGPSDAPVKLVLFSDFECHYCRDFGVTLKEITKNYGDKVHLVFRQFPLTNIHANAQRAAEASLCAQGQKRFWEVHDILFENQRDLTEENILARIKPLDIDMEKFRECLTSGRYKSAVGEDIRAGSAAGINSTPMLFINGLSLSGNQPYEAVADMINKELGVDKEQ